MLQVKILNHSNNDLPQYQTPYSAGMDLKAYLKESLILMPGQRARIPTGLYIELPAGYEGQVRPRSGLAARHGVTVLNSPGTIDADYRGEIQVILVNLGEEPFEINNGDRIAQLIIAPVTQVVWKQEPFLSDTERGHGGFGHTGK